MLDKEKLLQSKIEALFDAMFVLCAEKRISALKHALKVADGDLGAVLKAGF